MQIQAAPCQLALVPGNASRHSSAYGCRRGPEESRIRDLQAEAQLSPASRKLLTGGIKANRYIVQGQK